MCKYRGEPFLNCKRNSQPLEDIGVRIPNRLIWTGKKIMFLRLLVTLVLVYSRFFEASNQRARFPPYRSFRSKGTAPSSNSNVRLKSFDPDLSKEKGPGEWPDWINDGRGLEIIYYRLICDMYIL